MITHIIIEQEVTGYHMKSEYLVVACSMAPQQRSGNLQFLKLQNIVWDLIQGLLASFMRIIPLEQHQMMSQLSINSNYFTGLSGALVNSTTQALHRPFSFLSM